LGVFLPYFSFPGNVRLLNLLWESIYGLGIWAVDETVGLRIQSPFVLAGVVLWPIVVCWGMFILASKIQGLENKKWRRGAIAALAASSLLTVTLPTIDHEPWSKLPTFYRQFFVVW
jgi:hypothetical protein